MTETEQGKPPVRRRFGRVASRLLLAVIPALIFGAYAAYPAASWITMYAYIPWILLYTDERKGRVSLGYYALGAYLSWVLLYMLPSKKYGWYVPIGAGVLLFPAWLLFAPLLRRIHARYRWPRVWTVPLVLVAVEWIRATFTVAHLDLYRLGVSLARFTELAQIADIFGVYGLTFLSAAWSGLIVDAWFAFRDGGFRLGALRRDRPLVRSFFALAALYVAAVGYGVLRLPTVKTEAGPTLAIIQPNVHHTMRNSLGVHLKQMKLSVDSVESGEADLIVWPENAILDALDREGVYLDDLAWLARTKQAAVLFGALGESPRKLGRTTNNAFLMDRHGEIVGSYVKQVLFPWGEYIPFDDVLGEHAPLLQRLHRKITRAGWGFMPSGDPGDEMTVLELPWGDGSVTFAVLICNENTHPPLPAEARRRGARLFVNITSEGEVGGPVQEQLLRTCLLRAIENRVPYVRVCNTGISAFIDARGRTQSILYGPNDATILVEGVLVDQVRLGDESPTLYARSHDAFAKLCLALTLALFAFSYVRR